MKVHIPTRAGGTRCTGHLLLALDNFISGYSALRLYLRQVNTLPKVLDYLFSFNISMTKKKFSQLSASKEKSDSKSKAIGFLKLM